MDIPEIIQAAGGLNEMKLLILLLFCYPVSIVWVGIKLAKPAARIAVALEAIAKREAAAEAKRIADALERLAAKERREAAEEAEEERRRVDDIDS